jgi:formate hydrogenlyase transcriptional activator
MSKNYKELFTDFVVQKVPDAVFWVDSSAKIISANDVACQQLGYTMEELVGMTTHDISINYQGINYKWEEFWELLKKHGTFVFESRHKTKDGQIYPVEIRSNFIVNDGVEMICAFARDITDYKNIQEELKFYEKELNNFESDLMLSHSTLDAVKDSVFWLDKDSVFLRANNAALKLWGYNKEELYNMKFYNINPEFSPESWYSHWEQLRVEDQNHIETTHFSKSGKVIPVELSLNVIQYKGEELCVGFAKDITERKHKEKELRQAKEEIETLKNQLEKENYYLREEIKLEHNFDEIISNDFSYKRVLKNAEHVAKTSSTVLILGETGTGKELLARAIHNISDRKDRPLVKVNCAALPSELIESELFGHEKGAFTGAFAKKIGRFELADKGTIFLDEIGELPLELQPKLLRVLQEGEFERLGNSKPIKIDVRVIAATNRNLEKSVDNGDFRADLFYRLNVFPLTIPPLRQRKEDIPDLVQFFIKKYAIKTGKSIKHINKKYIHKLLNYSWPGNIRELENIIERAMIISTNGSLILDELVFPARQKNNGNSFVSFEEMEKNYIVKVLDKTNWKISGENSAAEILNLKRTTLQSKMKKLGIEKSN